MFLLKTQSNQSNQIKSIMKNSLLLLGIAFVSITNACNATSAVGRPFTSFQEDFLAFEAERMVAVKKAVTVKPAICTDTELFDPETVIAYNRKTIEEIIIEGAIIIENTTQDEFEFMAYEESMKEIIAQSDLIIENTVSNETYPLYNERTLEDEIAELEIIIESTETNESRPLNLKKINNNTLLNNTFNSKKIIGMN
jgi:hypothetical protein